MNMRRFFIGALLVLVGLVLLGVRQGWLPQATWEQIVNLWPLLLVYWGARMIWRAWQKEHSDTASLSAPRRRSGQPYEGLAGGMLFFALGLAILGAQFGWWTWDVLIAAPFLGLGIGMMLRALTSPGSPGD